MTTPKNNRLLWVTLLAATVFLTAAARAETFAWDSAANRFTAEVDAMPLGALLAKISSATGWEVFVEPGAAREASAKFKKLPPGEALRRLFGDLNFAFVPQTNAPSKLFVFKTTIQAATMRVAAPDEKNSKTAGAKPIPNQLVVTIKPGVDINALAARLGAKVIGRADKLNTYLLQFPDEAATQAALNTLNASPDVASVDYNYAVDNPRPKIGQVTTTTSSAINLQAKPIGNGNPVVIGLIDTAIQPQDICGMGGFFLPTISVAGGAPASGGDPSHSSAMASTILRTLANNSGGQTSAKILPVDVYGPNETTTTFNVANGISTAVNSGANIINLSLGSSGNSAFLHNVITSASKQGVLFFAAAGNQPVATPTYPAAYPEVVAVTAGNRDGTVASYANYGSFVSVVAPGNSAVCYAGQTWLVQGTSASTAVASGLAAAVADSGKTPAQVQSIVTGILPKPKN